MATEISRTAGASAEDSAADQAATAVEDSIITDYVVIGGGVLPVDPTSGEGLETGYAAEEFAAAQTAPEDTSTIA